MIRLATVATPTASGSLTHAWTFSAKIAPLQGIFPARTLTEKRAPCPGT
jgi:hypothetical protein